MTWLRVDDATRPRLELVGPYIRPTPRTTIEQKVACLGGFAVVGLLVVEWMRSRCPS